MKSVQERFWEKVNKTSTCWLWTAAIFKGNTRGYGCFGFKGKDKLAHRISYQWAKGNIPKGLQIDHLCRVRTCVNPDHLEAVTAQINMLRGFGVSGVNHRKTHCPRGHLLEGENLTPAFLKIGKRACRICRNKNRMDRRRKAGMPPRKPRPRCQFGHIFKKDAPKNSRGWKICLICTNA